MSSAKCLLVASEKTQNKLRLKKQIKGRMNRKRKSERKKEKENKKKLTDGHK